jgi:hypothetical protein
MALGSGDAKRVEKIPFEPESRASLRSFAPPDSRGRLSPHESAEPLNWQSRPQLFTMARDGSRHSG